MKIDTTGMTAQSEIDRLTKQLAKISPFGFFYALHFRFALPLMHFQSYPASWTDQYTEQAYALRDPIIAWGFGQTGVARWSEIDIPDPFDILGQARQHGMEYGFAVSCGPIKSRTIASGARQDREFNDAEIEAFKRIVLQMHDLTEPPKSLTPAQVEALRLIAGGDRHAAAAAKLNISESALKARLTSARNSLKARTTADAIQRARNYRLL